jgi:membrane-associated phospholipid phosphatase
VAERTAGQIEQAHFWSDYPATEPWIRLNLQLVAENVKNPPLAARGYALASVAVYDAMVAAYHWKYVYHRGPPEGTEPATDPGSDPSYPSEHAAMAGAASRVLAYLFPERPALRFDRLAEEAAESRVQAGTNYPSDVTAGLALGRAVADLVIARARADRSDAAHHGTPPRPGGPPEYWAPPPGQVATPVAPRAGTWKTWVLNEGDQFRPPPPFPYGSPEFLAEAREVMELGNNLTPGQEEMATFWAAGAGTPSPPGMWNDLALGEVKRQPPMSLPRVARLFALLNVAQADAGVAAWDCKFKYWSPRPVNAIRDLGLDPEWTPLLPTPVFPSFVSGHSAFSAAAASVLGHAFPSRADFWAAEAEEAALSRLYGGIHFRSDNEVGAELGKHVGSLVVSYAEADGSGRPSGG